jgi:hypothetical protein
VMVGMRDSISHAAARSEAKMQALQRRDPAQITPDRI